MKRYPQLEKKLLSSNRITNNVRPSTHNLQSQNTRHIKKLNKLVRNEELA